MMTNAKITTAVVGGYLLGRTRKGKLALSLGMMLAGRKLNLNPRDLARTAAGSPLLNGLSDQVRENLVEGTKSAAGKAFESRLNSLADSLHERSSALDGGDEERDEAEEDEDRAASEDDGEKEPEPEQKPARTARKSAGTTRRAAGTARTTKKTTRTARTAGTRPRSTRSARGGSHE